MSYDMEDSETIILPGKKCGRFIGRGGARMKKIQEETGAMLNLKSDRENFEADTPLEIVGFPDAIKAAKAMVLNAIGELRGGGGGTELGSETIMIPENMCKQIIGVGGSTMKRIQEETGAELKLKRDKRGAAESPMEIFGDVQAIKEAKAMIMGMMSNDGPRVFSSGGAGGSFGCVSSGQGGGFGVQSNGVGKSTEKAGYGPGKGTADCLMMIPSSFVGEIIGHGGENIQKLGQESGTHIKIIDAKNRSLGQATARISGSYERVQKAKEMLQNIIQKRQ